MGSRGKYWATSLATIVSVALMAPAIAGAVPQVTDATGNLLPPGSLITASSTNAVMQGSLGNLGCSSVTVDGELVQNNGASFAMVGVGEGTASTCRLGKKALAWTDITLESLVSTAPGQGTLDLSFGVDAPELSCNFSAEEAPFTYSPSGDSIHLTEVHLTPTPEACALLGIYTSGDFTLSRTAGGAVALD